MPRRAAPPARPAATKTTASNSSTSSASLPIRRMLVLGTHVYLLAGRYSMLLTRPADFDTPTSMSITISGDDCQ